MAMAMRPRRPRNRQVVDLVNEASQLAHSLEGVRGVHIVLGARPTFRELRRYTRIARRDHARLSLDGHGVITIRPDGQ